MHLEEEGGSRCRAQVYGDCKTCNLYGDWWVVCKKLLRPSVPQASNEENVETQGDVPTEQCKLIIVYKLWSGLYTRSIAVLEKSSMSLLCAQGKKYWTSVFVDLLSQLHNVHFLHRSHNFQYLSTLMLVYMQPSYIILHGSFLPFTSELASYFFLSFEGWCVLMYLCPACDGRISVAVINLSHTKQCDDTTPRRIGFHHKSIHWNRLNSLQILFCFQRASINANK